MKYFYLLAISLFLIACDGETTEKAEETEEKSKDIIEELEKTLPTDNTNITETSLNKFVPKGYKIVKWKSGNLNMDEKDDVILVIGKIENEEVAETGSTEYNDMDEEERPLLILTANDNGELKEVTRNDKVVMCPDCGGVMGDPFGEAGSIVIKNGYFSIESMGGSSDRWVRIITFKYDTTKKSWFLHKDGQVSWNTHEVDSEEETVYSKKDFGVVPFEAYNYENQF